MRNYPGLWSAAGFSITEGLIASAIVGTVAAGTAGLGTYLNKQSQRAQLLNRVIVLQSAVQSAVLDVNQYRPVSAGGLAMTDQSLAAQRDARVEGMKYGTKPTGFTLLKMSGDALVSSGADIIATSGERTWYTVDGKASATGGDEYPVYVDLDYKCDDIATTGCLAAYRVGFKPQPNQVTPAPLGAPLRSPTGIDFDPRDYNVLVSYDAILREPVSQLKDPQNNVMITGLNRDTGVVRSINKAVFNTDECQDGQIASRIIAVGGKLKFVCHNLSQVGCPLDYVLQELDFTKLDQGEPAPGSAAPPVPAPGLTGTCVYRWRDNIPWQSPGQDIPHTQTSSSITVSDLVCNAQIYTVVPSGGCRAVIDQSSPGTCWDPCNCQTDVDGVQTCDSCPRTVYSSAGTNGGIVNGDNTASCTVNVNNDCGSSAVAHAEWGGTCRIRAPKYQPPLSGTLTP